MIKIQNMTTPTGKKAVNQFIIIDDNGNKIFQSYESKIILITSDGCIYLDPIYWNYSTTTCKYRNIFLNKSTDEIKKDIKTGKILFKELN